MDVLPVLLVADPLQIHRRFQHGDRGVLAVGDGEDFGVGEATLGGCAGGQDDCGVQGAACGEGVGELRHMLVVQFPGADRQPGQDLFAALVGFQHQLAEVGGDGWQVRHRADAALGQEAGEAGAKPGGEDFAVIGPGTRAQLQSEGACHGQDFLVAAVQEQDAAGHEVDEDQAVAVGAEGDQPRVGGLDAGEVFGGEELGLRIKNPRTRGGSLGEGRDGVGGFVQQERHPGRVEPGAAQRGHRDVEFGGVVGEGAQQLVQQLDACRLRRRGEELLEVGRILVLGDGLAGSALALLQDPAHTQGTGEGRGEQRSDPADQRPVDAAVPAVHGCRGLGSALGRRYGRGGGLRRRRA
ncbi:hypothetical protein [Streptomyces sp. NBC_00162]|uniref:hypothetical protein n=1 Tax=Streptomyces sp. NBC_00162 TaxID=2903629 RepID=UPI00214BE1E8|nr:hypothetical protein [Streptomyces sp. NBC_00162]UUU37560.1 hypothetical protein JIW86_00600 [Streptomyces sp. NBC_00162]